MPILDHVFLPYLGRPALPADAGPIAHLHGRAHGRAARVLVRADLADAWSEALGAAGAFDPMSRFGDVEHIQSAGGRTVVRVPAGHGVCDGALVYKDEPYQGLAALKGLTDRSRVEREFVNLLVLSELGFGVVRPVAAGVSGPAGLYTRSFLVTESFDGAVPLRQWEGAGEAAPMRATVAEVVSLLRSMLQAAAAVHRQGWWLDTFQAKNMLFRRGADGALEWRMCDVPRLRRGPPGRLFPYGVTRDLAGIDKWAHRWLDEDARRALLADYLCAAGETDEQAWIERILRRRDRELHRTGIGRIRGSLRRSRGRRGRGRSAGATERGGDALPETERGGDAPPETEPGGDARPESDTG